MTIKEAKTQARLSEWSGNIQAQKNSDLTIRQWCEWNQYGELCASLPVEEQIVELPEDKKVSAGGKPLFCIGKEYLRTELVIEPAKAKVVKHFRKVYADRDAEAQTGNAAIFKPLMPTPLLQHRYASAYIVTDAPAKKYVGAMPLYRQKQV